MNLPPRALLLNRARRYTRDAASAEDLVQDVLLRLWTPAATHCWLLATREALKLPDGPHITAESQTLALERLAADGLPESWGIVVAGERSIASIFREAKRLRDGEGWEVRAWSDRMLASYCHRTLGRGASPMAAEIAE